MIRGVILHEFIAIHRDELISRCRAKVSGRSIPPPTRQEIDHGVPLFLDQLVQQLRLGLSSTQEINNSAVLHGNALLLQGYTVSQVVNDCGDVCQAVTERLGFLAHELRNLIHTAIVAFEVLKSGNVGVGGSTGTVLHRSLMGAHDLIGRSLAEVRLANGVQQLEQFLVAGLVDELIPAAILAANARGLTLTVAPIQDGLMIEADRQVLGAVVMNLLQNAFKFTRLRTAVVLRVIASAERVLFEVEDECGGLPDGDANDLFRPFEQRSANRTGLGLGLAFSRWAVEAHRGTIYSRSLPGKGCVFTVDLPRLRAAAFPMD